MLLNNNLTKFTTNQVPKSIIGIKNLIRGMKTLIHNSWDKHPNKYLPLVKHHNPTMIRHRGEIIPYWRTLDHKITPPKPINIVPPSFSLQNSIISKKDQIIIKSPKGGLFKPLKTDHANIVWDAEKEPFWQNLEFKGCSLINAENGILICMGSTLLKLKGDIPLEELITLSLFKLGHLGHNINLIANLAINKRTYFPRLNMESCVSPEILKHLDLKGLALLQNISVPKITHYVELLAIGRFNLNHAEKNPLIFSNERLALGFNNTNNQHPDASIVLKNPVININKSTIVEQFFDVKCKMEAGRFLKLGKFDELRVVWQNITLFCEKNQDALNFQIQKKLKIMSPEDQSQATSFIISLKKNLTDFKSSHNGFNFIHKVNELFYYHQQLLLKYKIPMSLLVYFPKNTFLINTPNEKLFLETFFKIKNIHFPQYLTTLKDPINNPFEETQKFYDFISNLF